MFHRLFMFLLIIGLLAGSLVSAQIIDVNDDEIEITGVVDAVDADTIIIGGLVIDISTAEIKGEIVVGKLVKVHVSPDAAGNLVAREAEVAGFDDDASPAVTPEPGFDDNNNRPAGEFEIVGTLEAIGNGFIVVDGRTISIGPAEVKNQLVVGTLIKVHLRDNNGNLVAREVENAAADDDDNNRDDDNNDDRRAGEFEIVGRLDEIGNGFIVVNGQTISITTAEVKNQLFVGARIKVHLSNNDGELVAREVENAAADDDDRNDDNDDDSWDDFYTIRPGDTLSDIAFRAGTTVEEIARRNNIDDVSVVMAGTTLLLPDEPFEYDDDDDDNSGRGSHDDDDNDDRHDDDDDNSGRGSHDDDDDDDNSGRGSHDDDDDNDDRHDDDDDDDNSGPGNSDDDDD